MPPADFWATVISTTDVRNDAAGNHDMGNVHPGDRIHVVETYLKDGQAWYRANNLENFVQPGYPETWVVANACRLDAVTPEPEPPPGAILTDEAASNAFVALVNWFAAKFR